MTGPSGGAATWTRCADVVLCLLAAPFVLPVGVALALAVRRTSPGPALHQGVRVGRGGRPFRLYKLRTMHVGADRAGPGVTTAGDPRVTPLGRVLRRTKLDELPQLVNVLAGQMSLVGPRPEDPRYVDLRDPAQRLALSVRPGLTSPASLRFRDEELLLAGPDWERDYRERVLPAKLAPDCRYVLGLDLRSYVAVLLRTAVVVLLPQTSRSGWSAGSSPAR